MSGGVWAVLCPPGGGVSLEREKATSRDLPSCSWQEKYVGNCLLWFFLKSVIL